VGDTHFITITKEEFDKIKQGDRIIIQNNEDIFCYFLYVDGEEDLGE
jgi:hypothetical protein